jgi:4-amino-4-deoxy-L-arabinose transferase-like glycosyltransferase
VRRAAAWLAVLIAVVWFANLDARDLIRPDEGRYAEIAREMAVTGDWTTPRLNGIRYFEKPPLQYWATAAAYLAFGVGEWTARLYPALAGALTVLLVWRVGRRMFGRVEGDLAAQVAASMLWPVANAHLNTLDAGLTAWCTVLLAGFVWAQRDGATAAERRTGMACAAVGVAGAVMSKGLIGLVLPGGAGALYLLATRQWRLLARLHPIVGAAIVLAVCAPWFVLVSLRHPEFAHFFFVHEHFARYLSEETHRRAEPWWTFGPLLLAGTLPWTLAALGGLVRGAVAEAGDRTFRPRLFLACWAAFVFLFFSASASKLPSYILPMFPALAWLAGDLLARLPPRRLVWHVVPLLPLGIAALVLGLRAERYATDRTPAALYAAFEPWIVAAAVVMLAGALAAIVLARREQRLPAVAALSVAALTAWQLAITGHDALSPSFSAAQFSRHVNAQVPRACPLYSVRTYDQTLAFYTRRTSTLVAFSDEMDFGLRQQPDLWLADLDAFDAEWRRGGCRFAFMEPSTLDELVGRGLPLREVARDTRRVLIAHPDLKDGALP